MSKYRFKTQDELFNDFGNNWRAHGTGWIERMDEWFGKDYPDSGLQSVGTMVHQTSDGCYWSFTADMLILKESNPVISNSLILFPKNKVKKQTLVAIGLQPPCLLSSAVKHHKI